MPRLLFEKKGRAVWMSHLDLMRLFQRAFKRAGLRLTHTHGFNPRPSVSIALPLSVGIESSCELLDFTLDGEIPQFDDVQDRLNAALVDGIRVLAVYEDGRKIRDLTLLRCEVVLEYDHAISPAAQDQICALFQKEALFVPKKTKSGLQDQDIIPMIRELTVHLEGANEILLDAIICCQNPALNPMQLVTAIEMYLPDLKPDFSRFSRLEVFDIDRNVFR